jgi:hypothetical protein
MTVSNEITKLTETLNRLETNSRTTKQKLYDCNLAICDILHAIESGDSKVKSMVLLSELKKKRVERRTHKNDVKAWDDFMDGNYSLKNTKSRNSLRGAMKGIESCTHYKTKFYSQDFSELRNIKKESA